MPAPRCQLLPSPLALRLPQMGVFWAPWPQDPGTSRFSCHHPMELWVTA
jgi:hypothetical protein